MLQKRSGYHNQLKIHLHLKYLRNFLVWFMSEPAYFWTILVTFDLSNLELAYFFLKLGWISFRSDLVRTEGWDDENITSGDDQSACSYLNTN